MSLYKEIINSGIVFRRPFRVLSNIYYITKSDNISGKPLILKIESSTVCNLRCKMCPLSIGLSRKTGFLEFKNFKKIYDEIKPPYVNLTGIGEPLLNPEIFKIIKYSRGHGSVVKVDTNGTILNEEYIRRIIDVNPSFISVSIDGITAQTYESIRIGAKFEKVLNNLKNLIKYRNEVKSKTKIHLFFVLQQKNVLDLPKFIKFGNEIGVDAINGTVVIPLGKNKNLDNSNIKEKDIIHIKEELKFLKKHIRTNLNIEPIENFLDNFYKKNLKEKPCFWPWYQAAVTWDGYVTPCCLVCDNEIVFGNAFKENFMNIWNNEKAKNFRNQLTKTREGICKNCGVDETFILKKIKIIRNILPLNKV